MLKSLTVCFTIVITSFYFFPFEFSFLPGINTKMMLAAVGLVLLACDLAKGQRAKINREFFLLSLYAIAVSVIGLVSITINNTMDTTFATYIVSMWVWCGGAYTVVRLIKTVHGSLSIELVAHYLIAVCLCQCVVAMAMSQYLPLKQLVDSFLGVGAPGVMGKVEGRMYGIGASYDVAGMRFSAVLVTIAYLMLNARKTSYGRMFLYVVAFLLIIVIGNMISRSTLIGVIVSLGYWIVALCVKKEKENIKRLGWILGSCICVLLPLVIVLYHTNVSFHEDIRFAFEGFFSLAEKGKWETTSTNQLKNMYVFPQSFSTWIIGDGYFDNPYNLDPYYQGPKFHGYYMATDVGYLRFIFYFGLLGMFSFIFYMYKVACVCCTRFSQYKVLIALLLLVNYIIWFKVSSDLFSLFALFLCINVDESKEKSAQCDSALLEQA